MEEQEEKTPQGVPQNSEPLLPKKKADTSETTKKESWFRYFFFKTEVGKFIVNYYIGLGFVVLASIGSWLLFGEKITWFGDGKDIAIRVTECSAGRMDEITGEVQVKGQIKRGCDISLVVHNKIKDSWGAALINEAIDNRDGTFKFNFCKAVTDFVQFKIKMLGKDTISVEYPVDEIPNIIKL
jgi:hypothetical protein